MSPGPFSRWERSVAVRYLRSKRKEGGVAMISLISFFGITLAVAVLIIVMSVMNGFRAELFSRILGFEGHAYIAGAGLSDTDRAETIKRLKAVPNVVSATPVIQSWAFASGPDGAVPVQVVGVDPADVKLNRLIAEHILGGRLSEFGQGEMGGDQLLLGGKLADALGLRPGDTLPLMSPPGEANAIGLPAVQQQYYRVGALFETGMSEYDSGVILMPLAQAQQIFGRYGTVDAIEIKLTDPDLAAGLKPALERAAGPGAVAQDWADKHASFFGALAVEHVVMRLILGLLVVIAAMNIISGLIMLVKNKGRDIAILRTMGASRSAILRIFFMAGTLIGVSGTLAGVTLGALFSVFIDQIQDVVEFVFNTKVFPSDVYFLSHIPARVDWREVAAIAAFSCAMAMIWTLPPALRASRLDPVEALRYE